MTFARPALTPLTVPCRSTVATAGASVVQIAATGRAVPSANVPVATNVADSRILIRSVGAEIVKETGGVAADG